MSPRKPAVLRGGDGQNLREYLIATAARLIDGSVADVRLVLGAVGSAPVDQSPLVQPLLGTRPTYDAIQAVAAAAYKGARPLDNTDLNYAWRKKMTRVYVERALAQVCRVSIPERTYDRA